MMFKLSNVKRFCSASEQGVTYLKSAISKKVFAAKGKFDKFRFNYRNHRVCDVTVDMMYGGMKGIAGLVCETSTLDTNDVISIHGFSPQTCYKILPKTKLGNQPFPEGMLWLLLTGNVPQDSDIKIISNELATRAFLPPYVITTLNNLPNNIHPMVQLSIAVTVLSSESKLRKAYSSGEPKTKLWEYVLEDSLDLIATLPMITAKIYNKTIHDRQTDIKIQDNEDWSANFAKLICHDGVVFTDFLRFYFCFCQDGDPGHTCMHSAHIVGSALSDPYLSFATSLNAMAGPLLSNENSLMFLKDMLRSVGTDSTDEQVNKFVQYAEVRGIDLGDVNITNKFSQDFRLISLQEFARTHCSEFPLYKLASQLTKLGYSNLVTIDVLAGIIFEFYGFGTNVHPLFLGMSNIFQVTSSLIWDRALGFPIEHPLSMSTACLEKLCKEVIR